MPNLDIIYDVTTEVTWDERKTNKQVIYQTTSLPSFVTFDAFYFCLWPKTFSFERYLGGKALATDHRDCFELYLKCILRRIHPQSYKQRSNRLSEICFKTLSTDRILNTFE